MLPEELRLQDGLEVPALTAPEVRRPELEPPPGRPAVPERRV